MTDAINVEITTEQPVVAATLDELRYLVFQGMVGETGQSAYELAVELGFEGSEEDWIASLKGETGDTGPAGAPGTTLGWDVTDDGEGNVEMTYPEAEFGDLNAVRFIQQTLTAAQKAQARSNIGAADADANYSVRYNVAQVLEVAQKAQARENIGAAAASAVDGLTDTVEELDADVLALESISENQESAENVLSYPRAAATTVTGVTLSYNDETGLFTLNGTNTGTGNAIIGASAGTIQDGTALKPPAGVYRLELRCEQGMNPDVFWGVFYIGSQARYVLTDATGDTVEVYLDGNTMASAGVVIASGKTADHLTLSFALRRVGTPEIGKLLVDQINQMRALQRKMESVLDTVTGYYKSRKILDEFTGFRNRVMTLAFVGDIAPSGMTIDGKPQGDLNGLYGISETCVIIARYRKTDLNVPVNPADNQANYGWGSGFIIHFHTDSNYGVDLAFVSGGGQILRRARKISGGAAVMTDWEEFAVKVT